MTTAGGATRAARGRNSKHRAASDERDVARILGGKRHPADSGGPEDVYHELYAIQVRGGKAVVTTAMRDGLEKARAASAVRPGTLPVVVLVDRRGTRLQRWACIPLEEWAAYQGHTGGTE